ncbi:unnamed protein product [Rhizophagus irregularis]|nr:unnamed protein product [Rhizophagus irregularis]
MWEESFIQEARKQVTNLWETTYKPNISENVEPSDDADDELFGHIFKKRKIEEKDELSIYLNEGVAPGKTDILMCYMKLSTRIYQKWLMITFQYQVHTTSAPVERIFSGGTDLVVQKRCSLKESTIRETMCLKGWWKSGVGGSIIIND